jgi:hypothetical protein
MRSRKLKSAGSGILIKSNRQRIRNTSWQNDENNDFLLLNFAFKGTVLQLIFLTYQNWWFSRESSFPFWMILGFPALGAFGADIQAPPSLDVCVRCDLEAYP